MLVGFNADLALPSARMNCKGNRLQESGHIIPTICVPCCDSDPYCRNCKRICREYRRGSDEYYDCMDDCVPGGITRP
jgi:hypothetical protein